MSELTVLIMLGLLVLVGLVALGLGFVFLVTRGGSFRLHLRWLGVGVESRMATKAEPETQPENGRA